VRDAEGRVHHVDSDDLLRAQSGEQSAVRMVSKSGAPLNAYVDKKHRQHFTALSWVGAAPALIAFANIAEVLG
jgi:hypothetical protein